MWCQGCYNSTKRKVLPEETMRVALYGSLFLLTLLSCFFFVVSSLFYSSSCEIQRQFYINGMQKAGDVILGGIFKIHFFSSFSVLSFTSEPQQPVCHGWEQETNTEQDKIKRVYFIHIYNICIINDIYTFGFSHLIKFEVML